ncbi:BAR-domain-containing protein [Rhodofomes roseus]|uniref:BAR-domain-containing protein n=1 Tax=Rhodofomes roseus TaxID=34475 RepID=A0ABQ8KIE1_9APHY|nr:BAR-domain-containing protein [Rhodofomes roseus]KAH9837641.1 BAR-domain-containing protein [Rhodofomes roseus]
MDAQKPAAKKRKLTDRNLPNAFLQTPEFSVDSQMYRDLLDMERRLDWTMTRKRVEVQDALQRIAPPWQQGAEGEAKVNPETGEGIPAWQFRIDGRLLEIPNHRAKDRVPPRKLSALVKQMVVELDRDMNLYPEGNVVEWVRGANQPAMDGFTIRRKGDTPTKIRIILHLEQQPEQYKVHPELGTLLGVKEDSRVGVVQALWNYIKVEGLQDKVDRRMVRADAHLRPIFGAESVMFQQLPELVNRYLLPPDPIILHYTLNPAIPPPEKPGAWDAEVKLDDSGLKSRMSHAVVQMAAETARELAKLDDEIAMHVQSLNNAHLKRTFLRAFAEDPQQFIQTWLASQSRDLETMLASGPSDGATLGKLRQWAGEVISSRDKTAVTEEFRELEHDIELRRQGLWRLHIASEDYHDILNKKKECEALDEAEKLLPVDALGIVMIKHGEEFGDESAFGTSLMSMGRALCKVATLQETFAMTFEDTFLASVFRMEDEIKEYQAQRKKLESRRLSYDAAISKLERMKSNKKEKEKDRKDAEDELANAKSRYEETAEDVRARMYAIQENEVLQLRELTSFVHLKVNFVEQYLEVLRDVKANWVDEGPMHMFTRETEVKPEVSRFGSMRSNKSRSKRSAVSDESSSDGESSEEEAQPRRRSRGLSFSSKKSDVGSRPPSRPPSRPQSRAERKRTDSTVGANKDKEKLSVAGWASSADKDKDNFATLRDNDGGGDDSDASDGASSASKHRKGKSSGSITSTSPVERRLSMRKASGKRVVVALHDFAAGSTDELSFHAGDQIAVVNEVLDGWWMGELAGKRGLFPTTYTEVLSPTPSAPPLPRRPPAMTRGTGASAPPHGRKRSTSSQHPFGDHNIAASRRDTAPGDAEEDEKERLIGRPPSRPPLSRRTTDQGLSSSPATKKPPPPPPPRRHGGSMHGSPVPPPIPNRPLHTKSSQSSSSSFLANEDDLTHSPFDSPGDAW